MNDSSQSFTTIIEGWTFRIKPAPSHGQTHHILLLLHGHLGNENVMWILAKPLPKHFTMLSPRAPVKLGDNQYSWHEIKPQWPGLDHYQALTEGLLTRVDAWVKRHTPDVTGYDILGFSQGGVMAYALGILHPDRIRRIAAIASFLPQSWISHLNQKTLKDKRFFIAHGTKDEIVPVQKAHQAAQWLQENGADVTFCTADTGHKIRANCFNGLGTFFEN